MHAKGRKQNGSGVKPVADVGVSKSTFSGFRCSDGFLARDKKVLYGSFSSLRWIDQP